MSENESNLSEKPKLSGKKLALILLIVALIFSGVLSSFASESPDSFEFTLFEEKKLAEPSEDAVAFQHSPLPDYAVEGAGEVGFLNLGTAISGVLGTLITLGLAWLVVKMMRTPRVREKQQSEAA